MSEINEMNFKKRLAAETKLNHPESFFAQNQEEIRANLEALRAGMDEDKYQAWKDAYLYSKEFASYMFASWMQVKFFSTDNKDALYTECVPENSEFMARLYGGINLLLLDAPEPLAPILVDEAIMMHIDDPDFFGPISLETEEEEPENKEIELINLRWGYDGGGIACGPVEGNTIAETTWIDKSGKIFFVSVSRMSEFANVYVSDTSLFDLLLYMTRNGVDFHNVLDTVNKNSRILYEMELSDRSDFKNYEYNEQIETTLIANDHYCHMDESASAEEWLNKYNDGKIDLIWKSDFGYDEDEEDEEFVEGEGKIQNTANMSAEEPLALYNSERE